MLTITLLGTAATMPDVYKRQPAVTASPVRGKPLVKPVKLAAAQ